MPSKPKSRFLFLAAQLIALSWLPSALAQPAMQVRAEPVRLAPLIERLPLSGSVISPRNSQIAPQESGLVRHMAVDEGDRVAEGDVLLELDSELIRLELQRLAARREEARLLYEDARRLADEGRRLVGERNISKSEYESRLAAEAAAEKRYQQLGIEVAMQEVRLERTTLRAPFAGVIGFKMTEQGQWLAAGSAAFQLVQLDPVRVQARVPERYYSEVRRGTPVRIRFDAWPGDAVEASVDRIVAMSDLDTRSFLAWMDVPNENLSLAPGMSAHLEFRLGDENSTPVLQVPVDATARRTNGRIGVWAVRDGRAVSMPVALGRRNEQRIEVRAEDLNGGDLVVTLGNESLREGQSVIVAQG